MLNITEELKVVGTSDEKNVHIVKKQIRAKIIYVGTGN